VKSLKSTVVAAAVAGFGILSFAACGADPVDDGRLLPPVLGPTSFIDPDIVVPTDPTAFAGPLVSSGQASRTMYDGRTEANVTVDAWVFQATYDDGLSIEVLVNPEFNDSTAAALADKYAAALGRLPTAIRDGIDELWVHDGVAPFGNDTDAVWIHVGQADEYEEDGFLEESLVPAAVRATIQAQHGAAAGWLEAQEIDNRFISQVAQDAPEAEDLAQSFLPYFAVVHRSDRITDFLAATIINAIPARLTYFDGQNFDMHPLD
jgi:hypothetical protein